MLRFYSERNTLETNWWSVQDGWYVVRYFKASIKQSIFIWVIIQVKTVFFSNLDLWSVDKKWWFCTKSRCWLLYSGSWSTLIHLDLPKPFLVQSHQKSASVRIHGASWNHAYYLSRCRSIVMAAANFIMSKYNSVMKRIRVLIP